MMISSAPNCSASANGPVTPMYGRIQLRCQHFQLRLVRVRPGEFDARRRCFQNCNRLLDKRFRLGTARAHPGEARQAREILSQLQRIVRTAPQFRRLRHRDHGDVGGAHQVGLLGMTLQRLDQQVGLQYRSMPQHGREMRGSFARRAGANGLFARQLRVFKQCRDISGAFCVMGDLIRPRIGAPLQDVDHTLVQRPAAGRCNGAFNARRASSWR